jgi:hypothetical protein
MKEKTIPKPIPLAKTGIHSINTFEYSEIVQGIIHKKVEKSQQAAASFTC